VRSACCWFLCAVFGGGVIVFWGFFVFISCFSFVGFVLLVWSISVGWVRHELVLVGLLVVIA